MRLASYLVDGQPRAGVVAADQTLVAVSDLIAGGPNDSPKDLPECPALFSNQPNTVVRPEAPIWHPAPVSDELDWEVEIEQIGVLRNTVGTYGD
jgi:2-keto-4-pentenoate hydratase/2-oxohepta-3-ene-1,7-dioic acid hydratase in catechol pathway